MMTFMLFCTDLFQAHIDMINCFFSDGLLGVPSSSFVFVKVVLVVSVLLLLVLPRARFLAAFTAVPSFHFVVDVYVNSTI